MESNRTERADLLSLSLPELRIFLSDMGEPAYRADQIYGWLKQGASFEEMTNLPAKLRTRLAENAVLLYPEIEEKYVSKIDGTVKYLFRLADGEYIESVFMRYEHGNTLCISSQAGCRMGCRFCASTLLGKARDLAPSEMLGQIIMAERDTGERVSGVVMMGIGEPLDNYDNTVRFLRLVSADEGLNIGLRHISVSTCGLADRIRDLAKENLPVTLSISLHAPEDEAREQIMPINRKYPVAVLLSACRDYFLETGRRISFEYTLIAGQNDSPEDAKKLAAVLQKFMKNGNKTLPIHVNLIPMNRVDETGLSGSEEGRVRQFAAELSRLRINATVRRRLGSDINASCGQLRRRAHRDA